MPPPVAPSLMVLNVPIVVAEVVTALAFATPALDAVPVYAMAVLLDRFNVITPEFPSVAVPFQ